jgi:hypothetical protein
LWEFRGKIGKGIEREEHVGVDSKREVNFGDAFSQRRQKEDCYVTSLKRLNSIVDVAQLNYTIIAIPSEKPNLQNSH